MNNINIQCENKQNLTKILNYRNVKHKQSVYSKAVPGIIIMANFKDHRQCFLKFAIMWMTIMVAN